MKRILYCFMLAAGFSLLVGTAVFAGTTGTGVFGATDLMVTPTPQTLSPGTLSLSASFREGGVSYFNADLGLAEDLEVGLTAAAFPAETNLSLRGKYRILRENGDNPGLAVGVEDISSGDISPYLVLQKTFSQAGIQGYLGFGGGDFNGLFGGVCKNFTFAKQKGNAMKNMELYVEADSRRVNAGARLGIGSRVQLNFGVLDMRDWMLGVRFAIK